MQGSKAVKGLNIGCGETWWDYPKHEGLDIKDYGQTWVLDVRKLALRSEISGYNEVMAYHVLEHLTSDEVVELLRVVYERLNPDGIFKIIVPHKNTDEAWVLTHKTFFTEATFLLLDKPIVREELSLPPWRVEEVVTNNREDIFCRLKKLS
jgi:predicted SAM-dependent methyltransferase